jgi:hypothetical protein
VQRQIGCSAEESKIYKEPNSNFCLGYYVINNTGINLRIRDSNIYIYIKDKIYKKSIK